MARNFRGTKFSRFSRICLRPRKFYPQRKPHPFHAKPFESLASVCAMAMYRFFSSVDKLPKLPDPTGCLPTKVPSSSIVLANAGVKSGLKSLLAKGKGLYVKLSPDVDDGLYSLTWLLLANGSIFINLVSTHHRLNAKLARHHRTFTCDVGVVSIHPVWA